MQYQKTDVRERILESGKAEFAEFGFASASVRNIADNAGVSMGNLYRYFENKDMLFRAVTEPFLKRITDYIALEFDFSDAYLTGFATVFTDFWEKHKTEVEIIRRSTSGQSAEFFTAVAEALAQKADRHVGQRNEEAARTLRREGFFQTLAACFCYGIREISLDEKQLGQKPERIRRLVVYLFSDMEKRGN